MCRIVKAIVLMDTALICLALISAIPAVTYASVKGRASNGIMYDMR